jgi:hypothetical protein
MSQRPHEIPTHLDVEDKLLFGLTARQFLYLVVGCSLAYGVWQQPGELPLAARATLTSACLLAAVLIALVRPLGRPMEEWLVAALFHLATPRQATWRPPEPLASDWRPPGSSWHELAPSLVWAEDDEEVEP